MVHFQNRHNWTNKLQFLCGCTTRRDAELLLWLPRPSQASRFPRYSDSEILSLRILGLRADRASPAIAKARMRPCRSPARGVRLRRGRSVRGKARPHPSPGPCPGCAARAMAPGRCLRLLLLALPALAAVAEERDTERERSLPMRLACVASSVGRGPGPAGDQRRSLDAVSAPLGRALLDMARLDESKDSREARA